MHNSNLTLLITLLLSILLWAPQTLKAQTTSGPDELSLGSIDFPTSANGEAQKEFLTGVLALHSFWYPEARDHFRKARQLAPGFAMAYWGEAMTRDHPIWEQHDQEAGAEVLEKLDQQIEEGNVHWSDRERQYVEAVRILYNNEMDMDERRKQYAAAMEKLYTEHPSDESLAFLALASMTVPGYNYSNPDVDDVVPIAAKLEKLYQRNPEHPGGMHYLIHLYDNDTFAELGLRPAHDYASVAYSSSHAIHMPSHIYKQLEQWQKVIQSNIRAWEASVEWQKRTSRPLKDRDYHSYRWLFEAYLEIDNYQKACDIMNNMRDLKKKAEQREEDLGRIPSLIDNFQGQYEEKAEDGAPTCKV